MNRLLAYTPRGQYLGQGDNNENHGSRGKQGVGQSPD